MPLPKFSEMSAPIQVGVILGLGVAVWAASEFTLLKGVSDENVKKQAAVDKLDKENEPLRQYRQKLRVLEAENHQLEAQLLNLQRIVPNEKEVDNFVRLVQTEASSSGVAIRRFTAKNIVQQQFYVEVPFEIELDGAFYDVLQFYDRLGRLERIINVSDLDLTALEGGRTATKYEYGPNETVAAVCSVTTFFSREEVPPPAAAGRGRRAPARPAARTPARPPAR